MTQSFRLWGGLLALLVFQFVFLLLYLEHEQAVHFWDYAMYANMAIQWFSLPSGMDSLAAFTQSFSQKYNLLFAAPSSISFALFGATRPVFILTNFLIYFVAYQLAVAFVLKQLFHQAWPKTLFLSALLCAFVPFAWYPLFQGYPDHSAAAFLTFAIGLALLSSPSRKAYLAIGALLGLSVLLRRHYAYPALAVVATIGLCDVALALQQKTFASRKWLLDKIVSFGLVGAGLLGVLVLCEPSYLKEIWATDYTTLYKSYERPPCFFALFAFSRVGLVLLALSLAGYGLNAYLYPKGIRQLAFAPALMLVWLVLWAVGPGQAGDHYLISILPLFCVAGLFGLVTGLYRRGRSMLVLALCGGLLIINSAQAFWFADFEIPTQRPAFSFFSAPRAPWVRQDVDELKRLATTIGATTTDSDKIVVVGSSFIFNQDLMRALYTDVLHDLRPAYRFLQAPESDGEQDAPVDVYATGTVFVVASPTQYHLPPEGQRVITALASRFPPASEFADLFEKDSQTFALDDGVMVEIWRRKKAWVPAALARNLAEIRQMKKLERHWVIQKMGGLVQVGKDLLGQELIFVQHNAGENVSSLFYDSPFVSGDYRAVLHVRATGGCERIDLLSRLKVGSGEVVSEAKTPVYQTDGVVYIPFSVPSKASIQQSFLSLDIQTHAPLGPCTVALEQRRIEQMATQGLPSN